MEKLIEKIGGKKGDQEEDTTIGGIYELDNGRKAYITPRLPIHIMRITGGTFGISKAQISLHIAGKVDDIIFRYTNAKEEVADYVVSYNEFMANNIPFTCEKNNDLQLHYKIAKMRCIKHNTTGNKTLDDYF
jgi:hypothetical protein